MRENVDKFTTKKEITTMLAVGFDLDGNSVNVLSENCIAKFENNKYYVKRGSYGYSISKMINPLSSFYLQGEHLHKEQGRNKYNFFEVPKPAFDYYIKFLKTKNSTFLVFAERECE